MSLVLLRIGIIAVALIIWFWTQKVIGSRAANDPGIGDAFHRFSFRWNDHLLKHPRRADRLLIISSACMDLTGLALIAVSIFGGSFAPFVAILLVFSLRQVAQLCCTLPPPAGMIWRDPGFPSILVTYKVGNDFFFSGHTALAVLGAIEFSRIGPWWLGVGAIALAVGQALFVLVLRAHYTLDVLTGALAAFVAAECAVRWTPLIDQWLHAL
jgi:membrane-associated phospholipid phosphatase